MDTPKKVKITLIKSRSGRIPKHLRTLDALALRKLHKSRELPLTPAIAGMIQQVSYLLRVEEL